MTRTALGQTLPTPGNEKQVRDTELAFAASMHDRNFTSFLTFVSDEAIFISDGKILRGKQEISASWQPFFRESQAPFSWSPQTVVVLESGKLALSSGTVRNSSGQRIAYFSSIWRLEAPDTWRIIFDQGTPVSPPNKKD
ncbi:YybH family protein [Spirosoma gilvum]